MSTTAVDARRHLDDVVRGEPGDRPLVPDVDDVHLVGPAREGRGQADRGLAVERAAAALELGRLLGECGIAVHLEELALDLHHLLRARHALALIREHLVVGVVVVEVVRGDGAELFEQPSWEPGGGELVPVLGDQVRKDVLAVEEHPSYPR